MERANSVDLRKAIVAANEFVKAGLLFVPMPVLDPKDHKQLVNKSAKRLESIIKKIEGRS